MSLTLSCPAKINLALSVGSPDAAGMHPIASWMVAINFSDTMTLEAIESQKSEFDIAYENDDETGAPLGVVDWPLEKDLCFRAHALLQDRSSRPLPCRLRLRKRIPAGAGLGGGSSNAATTLVGLNRLFDLNLDRAALIDISKQLGSDIAFFIAAHEKQTSSLVTGLGEALEPAPRPEGAGTIDVVLILPPFGCPTGAVYKAFDEILESGNQGIRESERSRTPDISAVRSLASSRTLPQDAPFNDLAEPACMVRPALAAARPQLRHALKRPVHSTGSGSTLFVIAPSALTSKVLARKITATTALRAVATRTM